MKSQIRLLRMMLGILVIAAIASLMTLIPSSAAVAPDAFYVATNGNDTWSGRLPAPNTAGTDGPFATLTRAGGAGVRSPLISGRGLL